MSAEGAFASVAGTERVLVTGATGWLGRELIARLRERRPDVQVLAVASAPREFGVGRFRVESVVWDHQAIEAWGPTLAVHLAYLTRDLEHTLGTQEYELRNRRLTAWALRLFSIPTLKGLVVASSGAAVVQRDTTYGRLKATDEITFLAAGRKAEIPTLVARIWSVSGAYCTKPAHFALYDLIHQAKVGPVVRIRSSHEVWRRYIDAGEYLEVCLTAVAFGATEVIDSEGELVELGELASRIQTALRVTRPIERPSPCGVSDKYFSNSTTMRRWAQQIGLNLSSLEQQIVRASGT